MNLKIPKYEIKSIKDAEGNIQEPVSNQEMTQNLIEYAVNVHYSKDEPATPGTKARKVPTLSGSQGRMFGRIQRKLDDAVDQKKDEIEINADELDFISKAVDNCAFIPSYFRYVVLLDEAFKKIDETGA